jgi:hypothetical protein
MGWFNKTWQFSSNGVTSVVTELQMYRLYLSIADGKPLWKETFPNHSYRHRVKDHMMKRVLVDKYLCEYTAGTWFITSEQPAIRYDLLPVK